jgi:hypothetical protein
MKTFSKIKKQNTKDATLTLTTKKDDVGGYSILVQGVSKKQA